MFNSFDVLNTFDLVAKPLQAGVIEALYDNDELLEPVTVGEVSRFYLSDSTADDQVMLEAVTSTRNRLTKTMRAFIRTLNQAFSGTDLSAGSDGTDVSEGTQSVMGGAEIGRARRIGGIPVMVAVIPVSDGQTVSILFHSPTSNGASIKAEDTLTAFKFLLNKKDVTAIVAPIRGKDVTLRQTCMALANLVEKNSDKFRKRQALNNTIRAQIEKEQGELESKEGELQSLIEQADTIKANAQSVIDANSTVKTELAKQKKTNADLEKQLERAKTALANKAPVKDTADSVLLKMGSNLTDVAPLAGGGKVEATPDGIELTDKDGVKHLFKVARNKDVAAYEQAQKEAIATVMAAYDAGNLDQVIAANVQAPPPEKPVVDIQDMDSAIQALSEVTNIDPSFITAWIKKNNMALIDVTTFMNDASIGDDNRIDYIWSGVKYPDATESVAELKSHYDSYISQGEDLSKFTPQDVKAVASLLIQESIDRAKETNARVNSVISMADGSDFSKMPPQYALASQAAILVVAALGSKTEKRAMIKAVGANAERVKATTLLTRLRLADSLLVDNGLEPLFAMKTNDEPPAQEEPKHGAFVYLLKARPAAPGAIPEGSVSIMADYSGPYSDQARYGAVTYDAPLTEEQASQFELKKVPSESDLAAMSAFIVADIVDRNIADRYVKMDAETVKKYVSPLLAKQFPNVATLNDDDLNAVLAGVLPQIEEAVQKNSGDDMKDVTDFLTKMTDYQAPTIGDAKEKQAQISSAVMALAEAGVLDDHEALVNSAVDNMTANFKRLMG